TLFDLFNERTGGTNPGTSLRLQNCSAFIVGDSAVRLEDGIACGLTVENCVFSSPDGDSVPRGLAALFEQTGNKPSKISYSSSQSCYHNLKALWLRSSYQGVQETIADWNQFQQRFDVVGEKPQDWASSPWENAKPLQVARNDHPELAFRLK